MFKIVYCMAQFAEFKKLASERIQSIPANDRDSFALVAAMNGSAKMGFDSCAESIDVLRSFIDICYCADQSGGLYLPGEYRGGGMPMFIFKDRGGRFKAIVDEHNEYLVALKRYNFLAKYKDIEAPSATNLSVFLEDSSSCIGRDLYKDFIGSCEFVCVANIAGEYGWGAFTAFADDIDVLINTLIRISDRSPVVRLKAVSDIPQW